MEGGREGGKWVEGGREGVEGGRDQVREMKLVEDKRERKGERIKRGRSLVERERKGGGGKGKKATKPLTSFFLFLSPLETLFLRA